VQGGRIRVVCAHLVSWRHGHAHDRTVERCKPVAGDGVDAFWGCGSSDGPRGSRCPTGYGALQTYTGDALGGEKDKAHDSYSPDARG